MTRRFDGKVALVTGGGTGIGAAVSARLADDGAAVVVAQSTAHRAEDAVAALAASGRTLTPAGADLAEAEACRHLVASVIEQHGRIDILVNNAAVTGPPAVGPLLEFTDAHLDAVIDVNLKAAFRCAREAARDMAVRHEGVIVNISSVAAYAGQLQASAYTASKAGMNGLTRGMAFELAPLGIRVVGVAPGDIVVRDDGSPPSGGDQRFLRDTPLGRRGHPDDIGSVVAFLCSDDAGFITGGTVVVDGGWLTY